MIHVINCFPYTPPQGCEKVIQGKKKKSLGVTLSYRKWKSFQQRMNRVYSNKTYKFVKTKDMDTITIQATFNSADYAIFKSLFEKFDVKTQIISTDKNSLSDKQKDLILKGLEQAEQGLVKNHTEVIKKARLVCGL